MRWNYTSLDDGEKRDVGRLLSLCQAEFGKISERIKDTPSAFKFAEKQKFISNFSGRLRKGYGSVRELHNLVSDARIFVSEFTSTTQEVHRNSDPGTRFAINKLLEKISEDTNPLLGHLLQLENIISKAVLLDTLTPDEMPAPIHVVRVGDKIILNDKLTRRGDLSDAALEIVKSEAAAMLLTAIKEMEKTTNVDKRITVSLRQFHNLLVDGIRSFAPESGGIQLDLTRRLIKRHEDEIPTTIYEMISEATDVVETALNQYEEYRKYRKAKDTRAYDSEDALKASQLADSMATAIKREQQVFDIKIGDVLKQLAYDAKVFVEYADIYTPPLIGSLSNICSRLVGVMLDVIPYAESGYQTLHDVPGISYIVTIIASGILLKFSNQLQQFEALAFVDRAIK